MSSAEKVVVSEQDFRKRFLYEQRDLLGQGGFARVYKAYDRQFEETVALKFYTNTDADKYDIISEMKNSRKFTHKNVIRVHDACIVRFINSFGVAEDVQVGILEYANAGNLSDFLQAGPSEEEFKNVVVGILQGLNYLHTEKGVIHRDLSPDNILMFKDQDKWTPKIADFGISKHVDVKTINLGNQKVSSELVGKMEYMAPEQFDPHKYGVNGRISTTVDLWAFGIVLTEIFTHATPFGDRNSAQNPMEIMHNVLNAPLPSQINKIPEPYRQVIQKCLVKKAGNRVKSAKELIDLLSVQSQPKRDSRVLVIITLAALLVVSGFLWYWYPWGVSREVQPVPSGAGRSQEEKMVLVSADQQNNTKEESPEPMQKLKNPNLPKDKITEEIQNRAPAKKEDENKAPASLPKVNGVQKKKELIQKLSTALKLLDNDIVDSRIRSNQINSYISEIFIHKQIPVILEEDGSISQQEIQDFLEHVVKTAGMEKRTWEVDGTLTKLKGDKISELKLSKN